MELDDLLATSDVVCVMAPLTDETYHMHDYGTSTYTQGRASCDNYNTGWTEGKGNTWSHYYGGIKLCNQLLEDIMDTPANTDSEKEWKNQIIGQATFYAPTTIICYIVSMDVFH